MRRYTLDTRKYVAKTNDDLGFFSAKNVSESICIAFLSGISGRGHVNVWVVRSRHVTQSFYV